MADWLVGECIVFGVFTQNWMWLVAAAFLVYGVAAVFMRHDPAA
jgi:hypothetical protein